MINCCQRYPQACKPAATDALGQMIKGISDEINGGCKDKLTSFPQKKGVITTYRGSGYMPPGLAVGTVLKTIGFLSTSFNESKAKNFAGKNYLVTLIMTTSVQGISLGECSVFQGASSEEEFLVNTDQCFKVTALTGSGPQKITLQHVTPCPAKTTPFKNN